MDEFALIDAFVRPFKRVPPPRGPGDDCAVLASDGRTLCLKTDAQVEGVHFTRATFSMEDVGHKALAVNLSDLAAMGARPAWGVCALGLPDGVTSADVKALARGMAKLANGVGLELVGGNVSRCAVLTVTMTVAGTLEKRQTALSRSGAKPGDVLFVTGGLGEAAAGVRVLARTKGKPGTVHERRLALAQRRPTPHLAAGRVLSRFASACLDVSDGLLQDLGHLCARSRVGADVDTRRLPVSDALRAEAGSRAAAFSDVLSGGEDYVLLCAVPVSRVQPFLRAMAHEELAAIAVGSITAGRRVTVDGKAWKGPRGFLHFR